MLAIFRETILKYLLSLFLLSVCYNKCLSQVVKDSILPRKDSILKKQPIKKPDSLKKITPDSSDRTVIVSVKQDTAVLKLPDTVKTIKSVQSARPVKTANDYYEVLQRHPYYNFYGKPHYEINSRRTETGKDGLFYLMTGIILYFSLVRLLFGKYMTNIFAVFFRVSLKQKQIREQLLQSPLPSLLLNIFFIISGGIYISFLLQYYNFRGTDNLWYLIINSTMALGLVYLVKYVMLKMMGWIFNIAEATDTYVFIVFLVNKLLGILLIPFLVLLAFSAVPLTGILVTISFTMVVIFFAYRYIISYAPVRKEIKVSQFHFILYLCAFEIIPLLLIYKVLLTFLESSS